MIGICIPAHNEQACIEACLASIDAATAHPGLRGEDVLVVVVLDSCDDRTEALARRFRVTLLHVDCHNVGIARACGADYLVRAGVRWLAFTDADTTVSPEWLFHQLSLGASVVCGTVGVSGWSSHGARARDVQASHEAVYQDRDGHCHVHGANLGMTSQAYQAAGGFRPLPCSEDQDLVDRLVQAGASIAWSALPRVLTSARPYSRVANGFAATLRSKWSAVSGS
jgi:glycosyltransferase involved in cell wall biosynthesis